MQPVGSTLFVMGVRRHQADALLRRLAVNCGNGPAEFKANYGRGGVVFRQGFQLLQILVSPRFPGVANVFREYRQNESPFLRRLYPTSYLVRSDFLVQL